MTKRQDHVLTAHHATLAFFEKVTHPISPEVPAIVQRFSETLEEIDKLRGIASAMSLEAKTKGLQAPLEKMREKQMLPLSRLCRRLFVGESAILAAVRVPHKHASIDVMIDAALHMVEVLAPHRRALKAARIDPARLTLLKAEANSIRKRGREAASFAAGRRVPRRRLEELFASAHLDVIALQALVIACPDLSPGEQLRFASSSRIGKRRGRPSAARQQNAARKRKP
jgi:hypothetical protein